ncbi:MAG: carboxypeptidase regulatory-like domain-containing protein [Planctomycetia bacterium]|nr:carboxypeptidase regulatory-like domain-containing protein [Planctomycetia bacterium]
MRPGPWTTSGGALAVLACLCLTALGCSRSDRPPLGNVAGTVTLDGKPLAEAIVVFKPDQPGRASQATTDDAGHYNLVYLGDIAGAAVGRHAVRIITANEQNGGKERLPGRYNAATTLAAEVKSGANTLDFALTSR